MQIDIETLLEQSSQAHKRELENQNKNIDRLEQRVASDIQRLEKQVSDTNTTMASEFTRIYDKLEDQGHYIKDLINEIRMQQHDADHQHDLQIRELQIRTGLLGGGAGAAITILIQLLPSIHNF